MSRYRAMLIPKLISHWLKTVNRSNRLLHQRLVMRSHPNYMFGSSMFDKFEKSFDAFEKYMNDKFSRSWSEFRWEFDNEFAVKNDKSKFHVSIDVNQFKPDEINVKVIDNIVIAEGKHESKKDDGFMSRHIIRQYMIPKQCDPETVTSTLSSDGVLTITVSRKPEAGDKKERVVNIEHTGKPAEENESEVKQAA